MAGMALEIKKVVLLLVATLFSYVFVASGLLVGFLSILLLVIWPFSKNVYRIITSGLAYSVLGRELTKDSGAYNYNVNIIIV